MTKQHIAPNVWTFVYNGVAELTCSQCFATVTLEESCPHLRLRVEDGKYHVFQSSGQNQTITVTPAIGA